MWLRYVLAAVAGGITVAIGLGGGGFDPTPDPTGLAAGASRFTAILVGGLLVALLAYAAVEFLQTRRLDSIARQFTTRTIVLMPIAIAMNIVLGQTVGTALKLPVYLDSIGTILVGVLAGPIAGAATGILSDLAWTFLLAGTPFWSPTVWPFAIVAAEIGFVAGLAGWFGAFRRRPGTPLSTLVVGVAIAVALLGGLVWFAILPFYASLCGPALDAAAPQVCFQLFAPGSIDPLFIAIGIGIAAMLLISLLALGARLMRDRDLGVVIVFVVGIGCGAISAFIAAPIVTMVYGGVTASGTDFLVAAFQQVGSSLGDAVLQQALLSDTIDKTLEYLIVFALLGAVSRRVLARFPQGERAVGTVEA